MKNKNIKKLISSNQRIANEVEFSSCVIEHILNTGNTQGCQG